MKKLSSGKRLLSFISGSLIFILLIYTLSGCNLLQRRYEKVVTKEYKVSTIGKDKIHISNKNGNIIIVKNSKDSLLYVNAEITGYLTKQEIEDKNDVLELNLDTVSSEIRITSKRDFQERGFFHLFKKNENINYTVYLPPAIEFEAEDVNGKVEATDVNNKLTGEVVNGNIKLKGTGGKLSFDITNGKISAEMDSTEGINFDVVNGNVEMKVSPSFSGKFKVDWVNGNFKYEDFAFQSTDKDKKSFSGQLGVSNAQIKISTVNGKVSLIKK